MRTNIDIDDELMAEMLKYSGATTKRAAIEEALKFYVQLKKQGEIRKLFGKIQFDPTYDYKKMREGRFQDIPVSAKATRARKRKLAA